jgi:osmotically-inducible protein OsmY
MTLQSISSLIESLSFSVLLVFAAAAQDPAAVQRNKQGELTREQTEKMTKAGKQATRSDPDITQCINNKIKASGKLKGHPVNVSVTNGEASLIGAVKSESRKQSAEKIAKQCGAKIVNNALTTNKPAEIKSPKTTEGEKKVAPHLTVVL